MMRPKAVKGVVTFPDGREICEKTWAGRQEYRRRTLMMADRQMMRCCVCGNPMIALWDITFEHELGRKMGGSARNDACWAADGKPLNGASHGRCNALRGSTNSPLLFREAS